MMVEGSKMDEENVSGGEFETERIPTHTIEARSKGLFPAFEYLPTPKIQQTRCTNFVSPYILHFSGDASVYLYQYGLCFRCMGT